jgi:hypothetical protein
MAAALVCLAGSLRATVSDPGFTVRTRVAHAPVRIDWLVPQAGEWDVTVGYDTVRCEIYCSYRLKRDEFGRPRLTGLLLPPVAAIRIYADSGDSQEITVDPAGLGQPEIAAHPAAVPESVYLPGRRWEANRPLDSFGISDPSAIPVPSVAFTAPAAIAMPAHLPLRI